MMNNLDDFCFVSSRKRWSKQYLCHSSFLLFFHCNTKTIYNFKDFFITYLGFFLVSILLCLFFCLSNDSFSRGRISVLVLVIVAVVLRIFVTGNLHVTFKVENKTNWSRAPKQERQKQRNKANESAEKHPD